MTASVCVRSHGKRIPVYLTQCFLCQVVGLFYVLGGAMTLKGIPLVGWWYFFSFTPSFLLLPYLTLLSYEIAGEGFTSIV